MNGFGFRYAALLFTSVWCGSAFIGPSRVALGAGEDASNIGRGTPAQYVKVTGRGFAGLARDDELGVRIAEIRLESTGKLPTVRYSALGIAVYRQGKILAVSWNHEIDGELRSSAPSKVLTDQLFAMPLGGRACLQGGCEVRLQLRVEVGSNAAHAEHTDFAALPTSEPRVVAQPAPAQRKGGVPPRGAAPAQPMQPARKPVDEQVGRALAAYSENRRKEADALLAEALATGGPKVGAGHAMAALTLYQASEIYERQKMPKEQEQALRWALAILEDRPVAGVKAILGTVYPWFDKEFVARRLADFYWSARRYDRAFEYYDLAYRYVNEVLVSEDERNVRFARNSAGRMAGACTQQKWDIADQAMKELKERMVKVDAETRKQLEYWVRTGEPRLAARKC